MSYNPIRNLSKGQRRLFVEIVDYSWLGLELPMKRENWELAIIDYPRIFFILENATSNNNGHQWHLQVYPTGSWKS